MPGTLVSFSAISQLIRTWFQHGGGATKGGASQLKEPASQPAGNELMQTAIPRDPPEYLFCDTSICLGNSRAVWRTAIPDLGHMMDRGLHSMARPSPATLRCRQRSGAATNCQQGAASRARGAGGWRNRRAARLRPRGVGSMVRPQLPRYRPGT